MNYELYYYYSHPNVFIMLKVSYLYMLKGYYPLLMFFFF